eukprot:537403_1
MDEEKQYLKRKIESNAYGSIQNKNSHHKQYSNAKYPLQNSHRSKTPLGIPSYPELQSLLNVNYGLFTTESAKRLSFTTKVIVPYYMLTFIFVIFAIIIYYIIPFGSTHKILFTIIIITTLFGAFIGCICEYKWSAISRFSQILAEKNREWQNNIHSLTKTKKNLNRKVKTIEFSVQRLTRSAADLEQTLESFNELKIELEKLTKRSQQVTDVLDELLKICDDLKNLIKVHAKTELMVAYYDAAVFASRGEKSIRLTGNKWKNFRARLDTETRKVFDEWGGFDAISRCDENDKDKVYISDLEQCLSFIIDQRGFDDIYTMFN